MKVQAREAVIPVSEKLPPKGERVIVVTKGFRCLAFVDEKGVWRHESGRGAVKEEVLGWVKFGA